mgnify:CR=1 FL=1
MPVYRTVRYRAILHRRPKAILVDMDRFAPVWWPLAQIVLDEKNRTIMAAPDLVAVKLLEAEQDEPPRR